MGWSLKQIQELADKGKIKGYKITGKQTEAVKQQQQVKEPEGIRFIKMQLDRNNIPFVTEYPFAKPRRFRFDIALPVLKIAVEYEGLGYKKTGHTTSDGYTKNCEKYNLAASMGWRLYRYTFKNYKDFENDLKIMFK